MNADKSIFIKCECYGEGMGVDYDAGDNQYYFSYWSTGLSNKKLSWRERIRYCWNVLIKGKAFNDELILSQDSAEAVADFILENKLMPDDILEKLMAAVRDEFDNNGT